MKSGTIVITKQRNPVSIKCPTVVSSLKMWVKKPNPPTPFPAREGGAIPSPPRRGGGAEGGGLQGCSLLTHNFSLDTALQY